MEKLQSFLKTKLWVILVCWNSTTGRDPSLMEPRLVLPDRGPTLQWVNQLNKISLNWTTSRNQTQQKKIIYRWQLRSQMWITKIATEKKHSTLLKMTSVDLGNNCLFLRNSSRGVPARMHQIIRKSVIFKKRRRVRPLIRSQALLLKIKFKKLAVSLYHDSIAVKPSI